MVIAAGSRRVSTVGVPRCYPAGFQYSGVEIRILQLSADQETRELAGMTGVLQAEKVSS
jgi:hypothetical protein